MFSSISMMIFLVLASLTTLSIHPLAMAGLLMVFSLAAAVFSFKLLSSWFFYMLALVFLGGVMVVLSFMVSLCSNEQFTLPPVKWLALSPALLVPFILVNNTPNQMMGYSDNQMMMTLYQNDSSWCFIFMVITLIICMISAVSLSKIESGPLVKRL